MYHDILATQVNIRQLQVTLDMYFTIPTCGNIQIRKGMAMTHTNVKILYTGVKHKFTIMH